MTGSSPAGPGAARYERMGAAAVIAIRRPQRRNAIDGPTAEARALDLVLTGREISAATALAMGLVTEVVAPGEHVTRALEIAERIASFPQATLLADRWGLLEGLDQRMEFTAQRDLCTLKEVASDAEQAPARFTSAGRGG